MRGWCVSIRTSFSPLPHALCGVDFRGIWWYMMVYSVYYGCTLYFIYFIGSIRVSSLSFWSTKSVRSCVISCATIWIYILLHLLRAMSLLLPARWYFLLPNILLWISNEALSLLSHLIHGNWVELSGIPGNLAMVELPSPTLGPWGYVIFRDIGDIGDIGDILDILDIIRFLVEPT